MTLQGDSSRKVPASLLVLFLLPFLSVREPVDGLAVLTSVTLMTSSSHTQPVLSA